MEIAPYYTYKPPLKLALDLNIILDVDTLNFSDYSYIYGQLNHIILDFEEVNGFVERFNHLKKKNNTKMCICGSILIDHIKPIEYLKCRSCTSLIPRWYCSKTIKCKYALCNNCYNHRKINRNISQSYDDILDSYDKTTGLNNKFSIKKNIKKFIPRRLL